MFYHTYCLKLDSKRSVDFEHQIYIFLSCRKFNLISWINRKEDVSNVNSLTTGCLVSHENGTIVH